MVALTTQFRLDINLAYHHVEQFPPPSLQSPTADTNSLDSDFGHRPSTSLDTRCDERSEISHHRRDQGAEDVPGQGGGGGS